MTLRSGTGGSRMGGIGPVRLGSAIIGAAILLRADAATLPIAEPEPKLAPPPGKFQRTRITLPAPVFGMRLPQQQPVPASILPKRDLPSLKSALLAAPSGDVIAAGIANAPPDSGIAPSETPEPLVALDPVAEAIETQPTADAFDGSPADPALERPDALPPPPMLLAANDDTATAEAGAEIPLPAFGIPVEAQAEIAPEPPAPAETAPPAEVTLVAVTPLPQGPASTIPDMIPPVGAETGQASPPAPAATDASLTQAATDTALEAAPPLADPLPQPAFGDAAHLQADTVDPVAEPGPTPAAHAATSSLDQAERGIASAAALPTPQFGNGFGPVHATGSEQPEFRPKPALLRLVEPLRTLPPAGAKPQGFIPKPVPPIAGAGAATAATAASDPDQVALASGGSPRPGAGRAPVFSYDDELVLQIRTADGMQGDTLIAYGTRSGVYLPLGAMARFLDLAIAVSDEGHFASGWFLQESRRLSIDLRQGELLVEGRKLPLALDDAGAFEGELYLRAEQFAAIFPLELKTNLRDQSVTIKTLEPFPFEERLARERERQRLDSRGEGAAPTRWPREETPWQALSFPIADVELRAVADHTLGERLEGDLRLAGDLAFMTAQAFVSTTTRDGLVGARLSVGRQDPDARLLGPLGATEFQLGDVSTITMPVGLRGTSGRGLFLTNQPAEQASVFDRVDLRGSLPDGYEVELYRNNILIGSTREAVNGQYEFLQVPVEFGLNVLRFVFYGPQGQRREEVRRISVGDGRLSAGQMVYSLGLVQKDTNLFGVRGPNFSPSQDYGAWRYSGQVSYGITSGITASLGGAWFQSETGNHWLANAGIRTGIAGMAARLDVAMQDRGASAYGLGLGGKFLGMGFRATHVEYRGQFIDEVRAFSSDPLRRATEIDLNGALSLGGQSGFSLPLSARYRRIERADGRKQTDAMLRGSARIGTLLVSNTLDYSRTSSPGFRGDSQLLGSFDLATLSGSRTGLRASASYNVTPRAKLTSAGVELDHQIDDRTTVRASVNHGFVNSETLFGLSASRRLGKLTLAFDGSYGVPHSNYSFLLRLGFSFGRNPLSGRTFVGEPGLSSSGAIAMRAFRDADGDGRFGEADSPIEDITFLSGSQQAVTDKQGLGLMGGLPGGTRASFQIDTESLPDIAMAAATRGKEIVPRPGRIHVSDFAIQELSEIEGTAWFGDSEQKRGVSGLAVLLVDAAGKVVQKVRSEADGFFLFEQLRPGQYRIMLDPEQASRLGISIANATKIDVKGASAVVRRDFTVYQHTSKARGEGQPAIRQ